MPAAAARALVLAPTPVRPRLPWRSLRDGTLRADVGSFALSVQRQGRAWAARIGTEQAMRAGFLSATAAQLWAESAMRDALTKALHSL